jgi:uncharacterized protein DUF4349
MRVGTVVGVGVILLAACQTSAVRAPSEAVDARNQAAGEALMRPVAVDAARESPAPAAADAALTFLPVRTTGNAMIIRTGTASLEVDTLETAIVRVRDLASRAGGYLANSDIQAIKGGTRSATLEIRVPSDHFDDLINGLGPLGKLERVNVSAQDVGEEFTDITARVANGRRLEQRLIELIATRTGKLSDVLEIERELARVREEIERMEGRLRYLEAHAAISSLSIQIHEPGPIVGQQGGLAVLAEAFRQAWRNSVSFTAAGIAAMGTLVPLTLLAGAAVLGLRRMWRRRLA